MESSISQQRDFTTVEVDGSTYSIALPHAGSDYIQGIIHRTQRPYEQGMLMAMKETLSPDDLVLDVGANIGNHTLFLAGVVGTCVIAYEPDARLIGALERSIEQNGFGARVTTRPVAIGNGPGQLTLVDDVKGNLGAQYVTERPDAAGVEVAVVALDDELPLKRVVAIKIDVEGFEARVIDGAMGLIERDRPDLWIECLDEDHFVRVYSRISDLGYRPDGVFNASPTIRFVFDPVLTRSSLTRVVERLADRLYRERHDFLRTRSGLMGVKAKYRDMMKSNGALRDELAFWESRDDREVDWEEVTEYHCYTNTLIDELDSFFGANDEITGEAIRETLETVFERTTADRVEDADRRLLAHDASGPTPSEYRTLQQYAQVKALAESTATLHGELNQVRSTNANLLFEKEGSEKKLAKIVGEVEALRSKHRRYREDFNILREYVSETETRLSELTRHSEDNSAKIVDLDTTLREARAEKDERDRQLTILHKQQVEDREHIDALVRARDGFRQRSEQQAEIIENYEKQVIELNSKHHALSEQKAVLGDELASMNSDRDSAKSALVAMRKQLQDLRTSRTYRAGKAWRSIRTWKGFWTLVPSLISIAREGRKTT